MLACLDAALNDVQRAWMAGPIPPGSCSFCLEDRAIYLFDEWAADQDPVCKRIFYTALLPDLKARGKTVIVITHDDGYFDYADRIVKLQDGQLQPMTEHRPEVHDIQPISMVGYSGMADLEKMVEQDVNYEV